MGKVTGRMARGELPAKVAALYQAVLELIEEGADIAELKVSDITKKAGIGKGTAYDYFDTREEIIAYALLYFMDSFMLHVEKEVREKTGFWDKVDLMLDILGTEIGKSACILRFINLMYEPSQSGQKLREALQDAKNTDGYCPLPTLWDILEQGMAEGEVRADVPVDFLMHSLMARLISYAAALLWNGKDGVRGLRENENTVSGEAWKTYGDSFEEAFKRYIRDCIRAEFKAGTRAEPALGSC